jgi:hypothetical protein
VRIQGENVISKRLSVATIYGSGSMERLTVGLIAINGDFKISLPNFRAI